MSITLSQYIDKEKQRFAKILQDERAIFLAANSALAAMSQRIFDEGKSVTGQQWEYNATKPLYVDPLKTFGDTTSLNPPRGKNGDKKFKSGKPHKTTWVESYKALRGLVKRPNSFVVWNANNDLRSDLENHPRIVENPKTVKKVSNQVYEIKSDREENIQKLKGLMERYPNVFKISESEKKIYYDSLQGELLKLLRER